MTIESRRQTCQLQACEKSRKLENAIRTKVEQRNEQTDRLALRVREVAADEKR